MVMVIPSTRGRKTSYVSVSVPWVSIVCMYVPIVATNRTMIQNVVVMSVSCWIVMIMMAIWFLVTMV